MPKKLTKETAKEIIENKLKKETPYILFIGFEDNVWLGNRKTKIILKCTKHNIISSILYKSFIADGWKCNECYHENHRLTKEEAEDRIEQVHKNNPFGYKYIIPKDFDIVKGNSDIIGICPIHGEFKINYNYLLKIDPNKRTCGYCNNTIPLTEELAIEKINTIINKINQEYPKITFIGFVNNIWLGSKTKLILKCNKHDILGNPSYDSFVKNESWNCPNCRKELIIQSNLITPEEAQEKINSIFKNNNPNNYGFNLIKSTYTGYNNEVIIICPIHGKVSIKYRTLINHGNCPKCLHESRIYSIDKSIKIIKSLVNQKNKLENTNISFIGFINEDKWDGIENSKIKLRCNIHNITYIINYKTFSRDKCTGGCPKCSKILYKSEDFCFDIISSCVRSENIQRNFYIYFNNNKFIKVDFFIKKLNCIIEFDGIQHYEFVPFLQKTYSKFINQVNRDRCLEQYCKENNICLLRISYKDNNRIPEIIKIFFEEGKDITTKVEPKLLPVLYHG